MNSAPPFTNRPIASLVEFLQDRGTGSRSDCGFTFFVGDNQEDEWLRYSQLHNAARPIASKIASHSLAPNSRAIVLCPPGPSYLKALFGVLYSGYIAVTAYPPRARRRDHRLDLVIQDSGATVAMVDQTVFDRREQILKSSPALSKLHWINVDEKRDERFDWQCPAINSADLAILQYTSGSTSDPKGVELTHANLLANLRMIYELFEVETHDDRWSVTWLPPYHDMGLIGGLFQVMYAGECSHVMPPATFVQKPIRWLQAIERYEARVSGGPNFAYDLCVDRIAPEEISRLDLSSWSLAFTGAEPVRQSTLDRFAKSFAPAGFRRRAFFPCYGLAEATLIVSGGPREISPRTGSPIDRASATKSKIVSCGTIADGQTVRIVDPKTNRELGTGSVGEIWVAGENISRGYWGRPEANAAQFGARLPGSDLDFLRTGDLGYLDDGELFLTGRQKELIVIRGRNFQPSDLEASIAGKSKLLIPNASAAFETETDFGGGLTIVHEVDRPDDESEFAKVTASIRQTLAEDFEIEPQTVLLIPKRELPKTSSGKVQRLETKKQFENGSLRVLYADSIDARHKLPEHPQRACESVTQSGSDDRRVRNSNEISDWLVSRLATQLGRDASAIDVTRPFVQFGLDSVSSVQIAAELEEFVGFNIPATLLYEAPTISAVATRLGPNKDSATESRSSRDRHSRTSQIAIIGLACRLPGCDDLDQFWRLLESGQDSIVEPPGGRDQCVSDRAITKRAGWLKDPDRFDAALFGISPREANAIDPQHRLLLETTWRTIEDAAIDPKRLSGQNVGVFVGISNGDYERLVLRHHADLSTYEMTGNAASMAAHRISYHLNLVGPSLSVDTACSSSLVAVHQAIRALQSGDCESAVVAGVNLILSHEVTETLSDADMLSPDGLCKTFDAGANGYVRGEGCVAMLLKPLEDALRDGDRIHAVVRGSAVNQDGLTNGITAPNGDSQTRLYRDALRNAGTDPSEVTLIETHGTGTSLGDPIEIGSLKTVYGSDPVASDSCSLGAVKANIGHLESAAGLAGLLKLVLQLERRRSSKQPHFGRLNPLIDLGRRFVIPTASNDWTDPHPRVGVVSSFGFGGTNAHLVVGEYETPARKPPVESGGAHLITLSARNESSLSELSRATAVALEHRSDDGESLEEFAVGCHLQKTTQRYRLAVVGDSGEMIANHLHRHSEGRQSRAIRSAVAPADRKVSIAFLFSGQGGQHVGMGHELYQRVGLFRDCVDRCDRLLRSEFGYSTRDVVSSPTGTNGSVAEILEGPGAQTSLFVLQLALSETLREWGVQPDVVLGHSIGEYAAATVADVMDWQDALRLTAIRAQKIDQLESDGAMTVVFAPTESVVRRMHATDPRLSLAAIDGPDHVVVSGPVQVVHQFRQSLEATGTATRPLRIRHAFHSALVEPALPAIGEAVSRFQLRSPSATFVSTVTGRNANEELTTDEYWMRHTRQPVQFVDALQSLEKNQVDLAIEIGPHSTLCALGESNPTIKLHYQPTLIRGKDSWKCILEAVGRIFAHGADIDWPKLHPEHKRSRVVLPGHPFQRKRHWFDDTPAPAKPRQSFSHASPVLDGMELGRDTSESENACDLAEYRSAMSELDSLIGRLMWDAISHVGKTGPALGTVIDPIEMIRSGAVADRHQKLVDRICEILESDGYLTREQQSRRWIVTRLPDDQFDLNQSIEKFATRHPIAKYEARLVQRCGRSLSQVLSGSLDPLSVLFPDGDSSDLENLYRASPVAKASNALVAESARAALQSIAKSSPDRAGRLRVLEVGAGTGGTTSFVLPSIRDLIGEYVFTDISPLLLSDGAEQFKNEDRLRSRVLDVERSATGQGFELHSFDLVIGANVFHATKDIERSLRHVSELLRPTGFMIALEGIRAERFLDLVFGLTTGWWHFDDSWRTNYPLLDNDRWTAVLQKLGYRDTFAAKYPSAEALAGHSQTVLIAAAPDTPSSSKIGVHENLEVNQPQIRTADSQDLRKWIAQFRDHTGSAREEALEGYFRESVASVLGHLPDELDLDQPVNNLGIDSLMAIQLKNRLVADLDISIPMIAFLDGKSVRQLIRVASNPNNATSNTAKAQPIVDEHEDSGLLSKSAVETRTSNESASGLNRQSDELSAKEDRILGPMSEGQLALWLIHQRAPSGPAYNFAFAARASSRIDHAAMSKACHALVKRHPVLRTRYRLQDSVPVRVLSHTTDVVIDQRDCRDWKEDRLLNWIRDEADRPFDLEQGPVIRFTLLRRKTGDVLSIAMHHIAADLWSMDVLIQELIDLYAMIVGGGTMELGQLPTTYDNYVQWEQQLEESEEGTRLWNFWQQKLEGAPQVLELPISKPRPAEQTFEGDSLEWNLSPETVSALRELANAERTTLFTIVLAAYQVFLTRICGQDDLLVGTVSATRGRSEWEGVVGYFLNHLVLRTTVNGSPTFRDFLRDSQREVLDALEHQAFPFAKLVEKLRPARDASRSPLVQTMFIWDKPRHLKESHFSPGKSSDRLRLKPLLMEQRGAPFDLTLIAFEMEDQLKLAFRYNTSLFSRDAVESLSESLNSLIESIAIDPDTLIRSAPMMTARDDENLESWNATDREFDPRLSGYALFQKAAALAPEAIALASANRSICYRDVERRATLLAGRLRTVGVQSGDLVGLMARRSVDAIIAVLGIWKAGAAYLPLDVEHPAARLQAIIDDAAPLALVTDSDDKYDQRIRFPGPIVDVAGPIVDVAGPIVDVAGPILDVTGRDSSGDLPAREPDTAAIQEIDPSSPAYVIYTSGSTGTPKGTVISHRGLANLAVAQHDTFGIVPSDRCLQFASLSFDASVFEMVMAFHAGATLFVFESESFRTTSSEAAEAIRAARITVATMPPSVLAALPSDDLPDLHTVIAAGEPCSAALVEKWATGRRMFNAYGPTETTVWASTLLCTNDGEDPTIGTPIANVRLYIVDDSLEPRPIGIAGELCVAGPGLAIEYKNRPDLTADRFVPNPFDDRFDATMYRTGDQARWLPNGQIEFLGRIDDQVKIDGHRIEPGEVASALRRITGIKNAFVNVSAHAGKDQLVAYYSTTNDDSDVSESTLRRELLDHLPCYMVPPQFVAVDAIPLTINGKVDVASLPAPTNEPQRDTTLVDPATPTEKALATIVAEVLSIDRVGIHDNFFELGGASLQALQVADLATGRGLPVSAERMFQYQTVAELAGVLDETATGATVERPTSDSTDPAGLADNACGVTSQRPASEERSMAGNHRPTPSSTWNMVVESLGTYLPPDVLTTEQVIGACVHPLDFPLQRMTGIESRHVAGRDEYSVDLAIQAANDCLSNSQYAASELDLVIACNISRYDGKDFEISFEPSTASKLKRAIGATEAVAFDICNACAGFFTALSIAEAKLRSGECRRVMVVSGEYITHLTQTAQLEIDGFLDPRLACLTLGDAGAAVIVELSDRDVGFKTLDLYTDGRHYDLCVAMATDRSHGGAIMLTDAIKASAVTLEHSVGHAHRVIDRHQWSAGDVQHVIMHQTSTTTLDGAIEELNRHFGTEVCNHQNTVNNLKNRGNTASTTHWVAVMDLIRQGKIRAGDRAVFAVSGSGQTIGTALYQFDELPDRMSGKNVPSRKTVLSGKRTHGVRIAAAEVVPAEGKVRRSFQTGSQISESIAVRSASTAAKRCLQSTGWQAESVDLIVHAGVYRDAFLSEPAIAAVLAGELQNESGPSAGHATSTLAFDLTDSGRSGLTGLSAIASYLFTGSASRGMLTASEVENNAPEHGLRGIAPIASAITLERIEDPGVGLQAFFFRSYPEYADRMQVSTRFVDQNPVLIIDRASDYEDRMFECVVDCIRQYVSSNDVNLSDFDRVALSLPDKLDPRRFGEAFHQPESRFVLASHTDGDPFTSGLAMLFQSRMPDHSSGERWLIVAAGAGIEVGCVEYRDRAEKT